MNKFKLFTLISIFCLLLIIPTSFAVDGETAVAVDEPADNLTLATGGSEILASDWYFDSNAENDGNGSITNPYKTLSSNRIVSDSNLHLANGEYYLSGYSSINNVTIIGDNPSLTILRYSSKHFSGSSSLTLKNLTLVNLRVINSNLTASNVIFKDSQYSSSSGGVIESQALNSFINLDNCTFSNNYARFGGAIYIKQGTLTVTNSLFMNNHANLYGGSIVGYEKTNIQINDSKFLNSYSISDAGGAIYLLDSNFSAYNLEINNCSSTFGGAIISLKSSLTLNNFTGKNNKAKYDGGAVYAMYRIFKMYDSILENNAAENAGAIFVYNVADFLIQNTQFIANHADNFASAFYSVYLEDPYYDSILHPALNNTFSGNDPSENDVLEVDLPDLFIGNNNYTLYKTDLSDIDAIPSRYDLRQLNQSSSVKNQGSDGNCWAFASLAALESSILKATGIEFDFSEQNMKNLISLYSSYGWDMETNAGGFSKMAYGYLVSWLGPINENDDKYKENTVLSPLLNSIMHVQNILFLKRDNYTDNDEIKQAIMKYGGVAAPMAYFSGYTKNNKNYYYTGNSKPNHLVVIVGWDDNYSKSNFKSTPQGDGAWIVKNSWGTGNGEKGYYYVSYYDAVFAKVSDYEPFVFVLNDTIKYDKNYQYDIPGITDYFLNQSNVVWYKNKFTATDNEYLAAVSTYFNKDTDWVLSVYVNNKLKLTQSGTATPSYKTIDLDKLIKLNKDDVFEIVFKITVDGEACVPISEFVSLNTEFYSENISFISYDGKNWKDLYYLPWAYSSHSYASQVACIKAFTVLNAIKTSIEFEIVTNYNPVKIKAIVKDQYGNLVRTGNVVFTVGDDEITVGVVNGIANLNYIFDSFGSKNIKAKFSATGYVSSSAIANVIVGKIPTVISVKDVVAVYNSSSRLYIYLKDADGNAISGVKVKVVLGDIVKSPHTDANGRITVSTKTLNPGNYVAVITCAGNEIYAPSNTTANVFVRYDTVLTAKDVVTVYNSSSKLYIYLKDAEGNAISGVKVKVVLGDIIKSPHTDANGRITVSTKTLNSGNYTAIITCAGNEIYAPSSTTANVFVKYNTVLTAKDVVAVYNSSSRLYIYLKDADGNAISGVKVKVVLGNITKNIRTDSNGRITVSTKTLNQGNYVAVITCAGNEIYAPSSTTANVFVRYSTILTAKDVVTVYNSSSRLSIYLKDADGNAISGVKVKVVLGDIIKSPHTDANGRITVSTKTLNPGNYTAIITCAGNDIYAPSNTTANVLVKIGSS